MTLAPEVGLGVTRGAIGVLAKTRVGVELGARFGVLDDLEVGAVVLPLRFSSAALAYGNPRVNATFRFLKGDVELGARFDVTVVTEKDVSGVSAEASVPVVIRLGPSVRLDTGVFLPMGFGTGYSLGGVPVGSIGSGSDTTIGLQIPVQLACNVSPALHLGAQTGFGIADFSQVGDTAFIPLGFVASYALGNEKGPLVDIAPYFRFPAFAAPGSSDEKINAGFFQTGVAATVFLYL
jgi:hypothetical protein